MTRMIGEFEDIRPYHDDEVRSVLDRLLHDDEFLQVITTLKFPRLSRYFNQLLMRIVALVLSRAVRNIRSVDDFQKEVRDHLEHALENSADRITASGFEALKPDQAYLFISNHRDIAMDPALCNLILHRNHLPTVRIAIGDNLLTKPFASDLMRLNKSFIVKRNLVGRREMLEAFMQLSRYIRHSITVDKESIWIAQREGRAKDGIDLTDPAILKMFMLSRNKESRFADAVRELKIVPMAISYQWDPCDALKARELSLKASEGAYQKGEHEDIQSIAQGITGYKGNIHIAFGQELMGDFDDADAVAAEIDKQILQLYRLQDSHYVADCLLKQEPSPSEYSAALTQMQQRLSRLPAEYQQAFLESYANPVRRRQRVELDT